MKCERCGAILQDDAVSCMYCGQILQRVPDYNPLEDVIADEVKISIRQETSRISLPTGLTERNVSVSREGRVSRETRYTGRMNSRESISREGRARDNAAREAAAKEAAAKEARELKEQENRKRKEIEKRRALKRKQRRILIAIMCSVVVLIILIVFAIYSSSYNGQLSKGIKAMSSGDYNTAITALEKAMDKDDSQSEVYLLLSESYIELEKYSSAAYVLTSGVKVNSEDITLHEALIECYLLQDDGASVKAYIDSLTDEDIIEALVEYQSTEPVFSIDGGTYEDVQELIISAEEGEIYYTIDGTEATKDGLLYEGGIQLSEGTTIVRAIVVNEEGIASNEVVMEYEVEFPMVSAPVVTPSTGQYTEETYIAVTVPSGYTAYYTLDNTTPDTSSTQYSVPIEMPEGNTIFTVVLVNASGKYSDTTKRNYDLTIKEETTSGEDD